MQTNNKNSSMSFDNAFSDEDNLIGDARPVEFLDSETGMWVKQDMFGNQIAVDRNGKLGIYSDNSDFLRSAFDGASRGLGDYARAGLSSLAQGEEYEKMLKEQEEYTRELSYRKPWLVKAGRFSGDVGRDALVTVATRNPNAAGLVSGSLDAAAAAIKTPGNFKEKAIAAGAEAAETLGSYAFAKKGYGLGSNMPAFFSTYFRTEGSEEDKLRAVGKKMEDLFSNKIGVGIGMGRGRR